jgi:hypothetical protein
MCYAIFAGFILIFAVYSDHVLASFALAVDTGAGGWMPLALGWEMVVHLWPLLLLSGVIAAMLTYFVTRRLLARQ